MGASAMIATLVAAERLTIRPENREGNTCLTLLSPGKARKLRFGRLNAAPLSGRRKA